MCGTILTEVWDSFPLRLREYDTAFCSTLSDMESLAFSLMILLALGVGFFPRNLAIQISRNDFPPNFIFGAGTSAYQVEGAVSEDGRAPSIWDTFTHAGKMVDHSTADITADQYHKYKEDVKLMKEMGLDAYRFSISWSRLIPGGRGAVNPKGLQYYNNLINELISNGIEPHVTLHHLDFPQALEDEYGGWLSPKIVEDFKAYADVCFREFGDRVIYWVTLNEANIFAIGGYDQGLIAPGRCSAPFGFNCTAGNSSLEPYLVAHNELLAHAEVANLYRRQYKANQKGWIGINLYAFWLIPNTNSTEDIAATQRTLDFMLGWFLDPLILGDYPETMKNNVGVRLPRFIRSQKKKLKGSLDFIGLNHYSTVSVKNEPKNPRLDQGDWGTDRSSQLVVGNSSSQFSLERLPVVPWGLQAVLEYLKRTYGNPPVFVHENGYGTLQTVKENDTERADYLNDYLESLLNAVWNGTNTRGYFVWSFIDVFEVLGGYQGRYGLYGVNFKEKHLARFPKYSAIWYSNFLKRNLTNTIKDGIQLSQPALHLSAH